MCIRDRNTADAIPQNPQEVYPQEAASEEKPWLTANEKPAEEEAEQPSPPAEEQQPPFVPAEEEANVESRVEPEESKKSKKKSSFIPTIDIKPPQLDEDEDEAEEDDRPSGEISNS